MKITIQEIDLKSDEMLLVGIGSSLRPACQRDMNDAAIVLDKFFGDVIVAPSELIPHAGEISDKYSVHIEYAFSLESILKKYLDELEDNKSYLFKIGKYQYPAFQDDIDRVMKVILQESKEFKFIVSHSDIYLYKIDKQSKDEICNLLKIRLEIGKIDTSIKNIIYRLMID